MCEYPEIIARMSPSELLLWAALGGEFPREMIRRVAMLVRQEMRSEHRPIAGMDDREVLRAWRRAA